MSTYHFRLTVYAGRQVDVTEVTILTPAAGAVHSDAFKVTTHPSLSGWKPYLGTPTVHRGTFDPLSKRVTIGQATMPLLDVRTNTNRSQLERWVTAFLGDARGRNQLLGCKYYLEMSADGGTTWTPHFVGRIDDTSLDDALWYQFSGPDFAADLDVECFAGTPASTASNVVAQTLVPLGLTGAYAQVGVQALLGGSVGASVNTNNTVVRIITLDAASQSTSANIITQALSAAVAIKVPGLGLVAQTLAGVGFVLGRTSLLRCRFSSVSPAITNKDVMVTQVIAGLRADGHYAVQSLAVTALVNPDGTAATSDPFYTAFDTGTVPNATVLTLSLRLAQAAQPVAQTPLAPSAYAGFLGRVVPLFGGGGAVSTVALPQPVMVSDINPMTFLGDILDGRYAALYTAGEKIAPWFPAGKNAGDPKFPIEYDATAGSLWDKLAAATNRNTLPITRWIIDRPWRRFDFIEKQFGQVLGVGYRFQPVLDGSSVPRSRFVPFDCRLPTAAALAGIPTIADADINVEEIPTWGQGRSAAVSELSVTCYTDVTLTAAAVAALKEPVPAMPPNLVASVPSTSVYFSLGDARAIAIGSKPLALDALGLRFTTDALDVPTGVAQQAELYFRGVADEVASLYRSMFGSGAVAVTFTTRRTAALIALWPGDWCYAAATALPSSGINKRGDTRLFQITGRQEVDHLMRWTAIDAGAGAVCNIPTIGTPTQQTGNTNHGVSAVVTVNAQTDAVEIRYLIDTTKTLTASPADTDARWTFGLRVGATGTYSLPNLPSNVRVFVEARSVHAPSTGTTTDLRLPSAYVQPSGTKYVNTATVSAPTGLAVTPATILTTSTIVATWANPAGSVAFHIGIYLDGALVTTLTPNTTTMTLNPYTPLSSHTYTLDVKFFDGLSGGSAFATTTFATPAAFTGGALTAPTLAIV